MFRMICLYQIFRRIEHGTFSPVSHFSLIPPFSPSLDRKTFRCNYSRHHIHREDSKDTVGIVCLSAASGPGRGFQINYYSLRGSSADSEYTNNK